MGYATAGIYGYSHMYGGYAGGQAEYVRVPFADVNPLKIPDGLPDEKMLFLTDIFPTGYMAAENCDIKPGDTVAVWGCGPVGLFSIASARLLGAERIIAIDRFPERLRLARQSPQLVVISTTGGNVRRVPRTDRSSRPHSTLSTAPAVRTRIVALRRQWLTVRQIAQAVGVSPSTADIRWSAIGATAACVQNGSCFTPGSSSTNRLER